jgi:FkbH-like protein
VCTHDVAYMTHEGKSMTNRTFIQLKKSAKTSMPNVPEKRVAILADSSTQHLATALKGCAYEEGINLQIFDSDYDQIDAQIFDKTSELFRFNPEYVLLFMCSEKLYAAFCKTSPRSRGVFAENIYSKISNYWSQISSNTNSTILQLMFAEDNDCVFGNFAYKKEDSFCFQIKKLNLFMMDGFVKNKSIYPIDLDGIYRRYGKQVTTNFAMRYITKMSFSVDILPEISKQIIDVIKALQGKIKKCVILDLDNTLWGGVIGDDGMEGIQIGELGIGQAFTDFQQWLRELKRRGIILAVCSKNEESNAKEPFLNHPDMILRLEDISLFVANWEDKASNILRMRDILNIGMDSIVFFDDNPFERNLVKSQCLGITVPDLPEDPALYLDYIKDLNLFETATFSEQDSNRTLQYQAEIERIAAKQQYSSYDEYLEGLEMWAEAKPFNEFHFPRIAQLTQRSNQFNLRTIRYTEEEILKISTNNNYLTLYFTLRDKFGDHGLISVVILQKQDASLFVDTWLMSCRVLKRGMEEFVVNKIIDVSLNNGYENVVGEYLKTAKNGMVSDIYQRMGFNKQTNTRFAVNPKEFVLKTTYIKELD